MWLLAEPSHDVYYGKAGLLMPNNPMTSEEGKLMTATGPGQPAEEGNVLPEDHANAARLARQVGHLLMSLRTSIGTGLSPDQARHEGDRRSHEFLAERLARLYPDDGFLSEEGADDARRLGCERVWVVDPLDGTREFSEPERSDWAVHVALCAHGEPVAGAVALPALGTVFCTARAPVLGPRVPGPLRLAVSRTRPPAAVGQVASLLDAQLVPMGSAGAKAMAVARGEVDIYLHSGGQYEWDSAAPVAVARSAKLHASRADGSALVYNQPDPWLPDLVVCRAEHRGIVLAAIAQAGLLDRP